MNKAPHPTDPRQAQLRAALQPFLQDTHRLLAQDYASTLVDFYYATDPQQFSDTYGAYFDFFCQLWADLPNHHPAFRALQAPPDQKYRAYQRYGTKVLQLMLELRLFLDQLYQGTEAEIGIRFLHLLKAQEAREEALLSE